METHTHTTRWKFEAEKEEWKKKKKSNDNYGQIKLFIFNTHPKETKLSVECAGDEVERGMVKCMANGREGQEVKYEEINCEKSMKGNEIWKIFFHLSMAECIYI